METISDKLQQCIGDYTKASYSFTSLLWETVKNYFFEKQVADSESIPLLLPVTVRVLDAVEGGKTYSMCVSSISTNLDFYVLKDDISGMEFYSDQCSDSLVSYHHRSPSLKVDGRTIPARMLDMDVANVIKMLSLTIDAEQCTSSMVLLNMERARIARSRCVDLFKRIMSNDGYRKYDAKNPVFFSRPYNIQFNTSKGLAAVTSGELFIADDKIVVAAGGDYLVIELAGNKVIGYYTDSIAGFTLSSEKIPFRTSIDVVVETVLDIEQIFMNVEG